MNYRILIAIAIISVLLVGGMVYLLMPKQVAQPPSTNVPSGSDSGSFYQPSNTTNTGGQPSNEQTPDTALEQQGMYDELFKKLLAQRVVFTRVSSGEVYALYASDVADAKSAYPGRTDYSMAIAMLDITDDGIAEALVLNDLPGSCGPAGCPFAIYQKSGAAWSPIFYAQIQSELGLANVITNGHVDLLLVQQGSIVPSETAIRRYVWSGKKYAYKELAAAWDGTKFVVYGQ